MIKEYAHRAFKLSFHDVQLFAAFLFFLLIPLKNTGIIHYVIWLGVIATTANIISTIQNNGTERKYILLFLILLIDVVVSLFTTNEEFKSGLLYSIVCYFSLFWTIALNNKFSESKKRIDAIFRFGIFSGLLFSAYSQMPFAYFRDNDTVSPTLTLYFGNSNLAGIYIFAVICIIMIYLKNAKKKAFISMLVAYLLYLLWMTGARTCMVAAIFVCLSVILSAKIRIPKWIVVVCFVVPIAFVPIYLTLFKSGYTDLMLMGKELFSGRQGTFTEYFSLLDTNFQWLVGNLGEAGFANAHNAPLAHLCSTGLLGTTLFYGMMLKKTLACCNNDNPIARTALICILGLFIQSSGEASIFLGGFPGIEFVYVLFYLAGRKEFL